MQAGINEGPAANQTILKGSQKSKKRGKNLEKLKAIVSQLAQNKKLHEKT
jgi:hypothetical protein